MFQNTQIKKMGYTTLTEWRIKIMIILIDAQKAFDKIPRLFMIKFSINQVYEKYTTT